MTCEERPLNRRREALVLAGYAVLVAALLLLDPPTLLAAILGAPLVLLAPGLALVIAFDIGGDSDLPMRRLILSIALSVALGALGGILIDLVAPLDRTSWASWLVAFTCLCSAVAIWRTDEPAAAPLAAALGVASVAGGDGEGGPGPRSRSLSSSA